MGMFLFFRDWIEVILGPSPENLNQDKHIGHIKPDTFVRKKQTDTLATKASYNTKPHILKREYGALYIIGVCNYRIATPSPRK